MFIFDVDTEHLFLFNHTGKSGLRLSYNDFGCPYGRPEASVIFIEGGSRSANPKDRIICFFLEHSVRRLFDLSRKVSQVEHYVLLPLFQPLLEKLGSTSLRSLRSFGQSRLLRSWTKITMEKTTGLNSPRICQHQLGVT